MTPNHPEGLTPKQAAFVDCYFPGNNGTLAAQRAGYSAKTAHVAASRLLSHAKVAAALERRRTAYFATLKVGPVATMAQIRARLTEQTEGRRFTQDIADLEGELADIDTAIERLEKIMEAPDVGTEHRVMAQAQILSQRGSRFARRAEIKRLKLAHDQESNRAAMDLARLKGALDPRRTLHGDRKEVLDAFISTLVKVTDGKTLTAKLEAAVPIEVPFTPIEKT